VIARRCYNCRAPSPRLLHPTWEAKAFLRYVRAAGVDFDYVVASVLRPRAMHLINSLRSTMSMI